MSEKAEYCPQCGTLLVQGATFCKRCGAQVKAAEADLTAENVQYCARCGAKVSSSASFCNSCGLELARPKSSPVSPSRTPGPVPPGYSTTGQTRPGAPGATWPVPMDYRELYKPVDADRSLSLMEGILIAICSFPFYAIPGIIGWAVWRGNYPRRARQALLVGVISFTINVVAVLLILTFRPDIIPPELRDLLDQALRVIF